MEFPSGTVVLLLFRGSENVGLIPMLCADLCADHSIINCVLQFHKVWCSKTRDPWRIKSTNVENEETQVSRDEQDPVQ